ncbi:MAG TPA: tetratricopeptide repeat protein [Pirellulales bacterium]|jgi:tetratricopeptide (TPR) repeat protein|nr:tetratricopeptide repeat protein [Pirellulales bacterium]
MPTPNELYDEADKLKDAGQLDEAVAKYNEILAADPKFALAHAALAVVYIRLKKPEEAIQHAQQVCELEPNDAFSYTALSVTYQRAFTVTNDHQYIQRAEDAMARAQMLRGGAH